MASAPLITSFNESERVASTQFLIPSKERLRAKLRKFIADGPESVGIVTDFDNTLTTYRVNGISGPSTFKVLELSGLFTEEFKQRSIELSNRFKPIEKDQSIPYEEKYKLMDEWWTSTFSNYITQEIYESSLPEMLRRSNIRFRHGIDSLLTRCQSHRIPVTIVSAGLGNIVQLMVEQTAGLDCINVVSNFMKFDSEGRLHGFTTPMIHSLSKAVALKSHPIPKNLVVMGDLPTDIAVVDQVQYEEVIYIGFANDERKGSLDGYTNCFDLIILHDGNLDTIEKIISQVAGESHEDVGEPLRELLITKERQVFCNNGKDDLYVVHNIVGVKKGPEGEPIFRVRWRGYKPEEDTWEPLEHLECVKSMCNLYLARNGYRSLTDSKKLEKQDDCPGNAPLSVNGE